MPMRTMRRRAVYAGSFDPVTLGHLWMIEQAAGIFHELIVAIGVNPEKRSTFTLAERLEMLKRCTKRFPNVRVDSFENMYLVRFAEASKVDCIVRGIRNSDDYEFERSMYNINRDLDPDILTMFLMPPRGFAEVSSSMVKGMIGPLGWEEVLANYVPPAVYDRILQAHSGLLGRWQGLCLRVGAGAAAGIGYDTLMGLYNAAPRFFHTISHVAACLRELDAVRREAAAPDALEMALWFHDAVYEAGNPANEVNSAAMAARVLTAAQADESFIATVSRLITVTRHDRPPQSPDEALIMDIDLAVLGRSATEFAEYDRAIRDEYEHLSDDRFIPGRRGFLKGLLERGSIYHTELFQLRYETQARQNVAEALSGFYTEVQEKG